MNVATVLTVYGIETLVFFITKFRCVKLQQCLPFTVLKLHTTHTVFALVLQVATVLTVYGIETFYCQLLQ